jgi:hypothetical protein
MGHRLPTPDGPGPIVTLPFYRALQRETPVAVVGNTIFVFTRKQMQAAAARR